MRPVGVLGSRIEGACLRGRADSAARVLRRQGERLVCAPPLQARRPDQARGGWGGPPGTRDGRGLGRGWVRAFPDPPHPSEGAAAAGMVPRRWGQEEVGVGWEAA